MQQLIN